LHDKNPHKHIDPSHLDLREMNYKKISPFLFLFLVSHEFATLKVDLAEQAYHLTTILLPERAVSFHNY